MEVENRPDNNSLPSVEKTVQESLSSTSRCTFEPRGEQGDITVVFGKDKLQITIGSENTVGELKQKIEQLTGIPPATQKLMKGGILKDDSKPLKDAKVTNGSKLMLVGTKMEDVINVNIPVTTSTANDLHVKSEKKSLCEEEAHKNFLDKNPVPAEAEPGLASHQKQVPRSIPGILTKHGKVRLTFRNDIDQLWVQSATSTQKIPYASIATIKSEPIKAKEDYHIMVLYLGTGETAPKYFLYYVPAQYVASIKNTILGDFVYF